MLQVLRWLGLLSLRGRRITSKKRDICINNTFETTHTIFLIIFDAGGEIKTMLIWGHYFNYTLWGSCCTFNGYSHVPIGLIANS